MLPDFNRLYLFYHVYRHLSIVRAAEELYVTQSAVSQNLQKLEQELSLQLFHRLHKRLVPTPAADQLFQSVMPFYSTLSADIQAIHTSEATPHGDLHIGAPPVFGSAFLPPVIAAFYNRYPSLQFHLVLGSQSVIARAYRSNDLDIALVDIFGNREEESWNLLQEPLCDEPLILTGSAKYVRKHITNKPTPASLSSCRFIAYQPHAPELTEWFFHHFHHHVPKLDIILVVDNVHAVINAIRSGLGLGLVPQYLVQTAIRKKELVPIPTDTNEVKSRISLLRLPGKKSGTAERLFVDFLKSKLTAATAGI